MVKILLDKYPAGTYKGQQSAGKYMDGYLHQNLSIMADRIVDDMTFFGIIFSSTLEVGTGKSVLATQIGEAWSELMKKKHNIDVPFTVNNIVWNPEDLIKRSFEIPPYSCILIDEWEDAHYWSKLGMTLRQFFRKCRQLNLFMLAIIPNWFQMPTNYAIGRSAFAIDVQFRDDFRRGYFEFYNFKQKRELYVKGKKSQWYGAAKSNFKGRFVSGYGVDEAEYRKRKLEDTEKMGSGELDKKKEQKDYLHNLIIGIKEKYPEMTDENIAKMIGVTRATVSKWKNLEIEDVNGSTNDYSNKLNQNEAKRVKRAEEDWSFGEELY